MQGQRSTVQPLPETFESVRGSTSNNTTRNLQLCWNNLLNVFNHDSGNLDGSSSGDHTLNQSSNDGAKIEHGLTDSLITHAGPGLRLEEGGFVSANIVSLENENINRNSNQAANEPLLFQNSNSDDITHSQNLNSGFVGNSGQVMEAGISPHPNKTGGSETEQIPSATGSTEAVDDRRLSCKRKAVEEVSGRPSLGGSSSSFQQAENSVWHASHEEQLNTRFGVSGAGITYDYHHGSSIAENAENSNRNFRMRINPPHQQDSATPNLQPPGNAIMRSHDWRPIYSPSRLLPFHPSLDLRSTATIPSYPQHHSLVPYIPSFPACTVNPYPWSGPPQHHSLVPPIPISSSSVIVGERQPALREEANTSSMARRISEHPMFVPATAMRNLTEDPTHWSSVNRNTFVPGNIASSSHIASSSVVRPSPGSTWVPHPGPPGQYPHMLSVNGNASGNTGVPGNIASSSRSVVHPSPGSIWVRNPGPPGQYLPMLPEVGRWAMFPISGNEFPAQSNAFPLQRSPSSTYSPEMVLPPVVGHQGHPPYLRPAFWMDRQGDGVPGVPLALHSLPSAEGRRWLTSEEMVLPPGVGHQDHQSHPPYPRPAFRMDRQGDGVPGVPSSSHSLPAPVARMRLTSELIRNALDRFRRGEHLRFEDVVILNRLALYGAADEDDQHEDMRLDVDNMSYEELLALEEQIGNVSTGLSEETVLKCLELRKYVPIAVEAPPEVVPCCICQEEYVEGDELGKLGCGHDFHAACVKEWLMQKNICPMCKTTALVTLD
ncbi:putative E3 ubiquitin-protein ligase HIP1 isoform X2 [Tasmannia lanceolata]|uniref:putative E3 ubiquitin-protein ligase HIP1 isoform X2 n=1 Tax=Tasmannia lanceolata TaxID=3420 RepID=UPI004064167E